MAELFKAPTDRQSVVDAGGIVSKTWFGFFTQIARKLSAFGSVTTVATADATDLATVIALANALKAKQNEILNSQQ